MVLSNSHFLFSELSQTLYRAGFYVSYADLTGGREARRAEIQALCFLMQLLQKQNSEESFLHDLGKLASGDLDGIDYMKYLSEQDLEDIQDDLQNVPAEIESIMRSVLNNFSKEEARLYSDILVSAGASVAQAYDEKDDFFLTGNIFFDIPTFLTNARPIFHRLLMFFSDLHADPNAKYLYEENDMFDQLKISRKEADALGEITSIVCKTWLEKYPEDLEQTVQDYIRENGGL